jgi:hypothetical protein
MMSGRVYRFPEEVYRYSEKGTVYMLLREETLRSERRTKILPINEEWVLTHFLNCVMGQPYPNYSPALADSNQVPADVVIGRVHHNLFNRQIEFQFFHETFDPVPEGMEIPRLDPVMKVRHDPQSGGRVSLLWGNPNSASERESLMSGPSKDFAQAADIEANTPITVGGSSGRFSLKMVEFDRVLMGQVFYTKDNIGTRSFQKSGRNRFRDLQFGGDDLVTPDNDFVVFIKADCPNDPAMPFYYDHGQLKSRYDETGNNIVTKFSGECGVLTRDKIDNTTQCATDRGIATFFSPSGPMADDVSECVDRCKQELAKHHPQAVKVMSDLLNEEAQEPAVVEEKKVKFREWL